MPLFPVKGDVVAFSFLPIFTGGNGRQGNDARLFLLLQDGSEPLGKIGGGPLLRVVNVLPEAFPQLTLGLSDIPHFVDVRIENRVNDRWFDRYPRHMKFL